MKLVLLSLLILISTLLLRSQELVPKVYSDIYINENGQYYYKLLGNNNFEKEYNSYLSLENMKGNPVGTPKGIRFNFGGQDFNGKLYYGLIDYSDSKHPSPVWFNTSAEIIGGIADINIKDVLSGRYDMSGWEEKGYGTLGYRVVNEIGEMLYDGIISFITVQSGFEITTTITEGPFINLSGPESVVISFDTNNKIKSEISVNGKLFSDDEACLHHEIKIIGLKAATIYEYVVKYGSLVQKYSFKTAPEEGSRDSFVFGYASDSRAGQGGGERNLYGTNFYVMRKISALASFNDVAFVQFTGDLVNGYSVSKDDINLQYANWKRAIEPYAHYFPIIPGMGNHEATGKRFVTNNGSTRAWIDGFPFETESSSAVFADNFVNPVNELKSEDGAYYDPDPDNIDFPPYQETVFYYTYANVAVIVLNSNYFYAPSLKYNHRTGGNLHGYIMDNQLEWLRNTIEQLETNENIDHVFVTQHTPVFPNGGHVHDDMWYNGQNKYRAYIAGKAVEKGIIERRDQYLDILTNRSTKVVAILTGDEHNYNKVKVTPDLNIYPNNYEYKKLQRKRTVWQINNGSAGAPYYAQDKNTPWTTGVSGFTTQLALVLIYVEGGIVKIKVINPDTLELIEEYTLKE